MGAFEFMDLNQNQQEQQQNSSWQDQVTPSEDRGKSGDNREHTRESWENARENWEKYEEEQKKRNWDRWDSNASHSSYYNQPTHPVYDQGFAMAALILGLLSFTSACCGFSLPFGALGVLFVVLCKRKGKPLNSACKTGLILSILGILSQVFLLAVFALKLMHDPSFLEQLNQTSQMIYGMDFTELLKQNLGPYIQ